MKKSKRKHKPDNSSKLSRQIYEYKKKYLRALADYQNFEKRVEKEKEEIKRTANRELILELLPFLDNLHKAEIFIKDEDLKMIKDNFCKLLKKIGLEEIDVLGKKFNPELAEAIEVAEGKQNNVVIDVFRKGYMYNDTLLRPAQVKVSKRKT